MTYTDLKTLISAQLLGRDEAAVLKVEGRLFKKNHHSKELQVVVQGKLFFFQQRATYRTRTVEAVLAPPCPI